MHGPSHALRFPGAAVCALALFVFVLPALSWASPQPEKSGSAAATPQASAPAANPPAAATPQQKAAVAAALGASDVAGFLSAIDADRLLLFEARKDLPQTRAEGDLYLKHLKELAAQSDPLRLVPKVNRMIEQAPIYYDWLEKNIQNQADNQNEYVVGGARGFVVAFQDFQNTLMLIVINRLEIAERAIREATTTQSPG